MNLIFGAAGSRESLLAFGRAGNDIGERYGQASGIRQLPARTASCGYLRDTGNILGQAGAPDLSLLLLGENERALDMAQTSTRVNVTRRAPLRWWVCLAATRLGRADIAKQAVRELLGFFPEATARFYRERHPIADAAMRDELVDAMIAAGLPE